jgi:superfamily II DNA or RNA helicase
MESIKRKFKLLKDIIFKKISVEDVDECIPKKIEMIKLTQLESIEDVIDELFEVKKLSLDEISEELKVSDNQVINDTIDFILEEEDTSEIVLTENGIKKLRALEKYYPSSVQRQTNQNIIDENFRSGIVSMATGSGKSLVLLQCVNDLPKIPKRSILVFTERKNILLDLIFSEYEENGCKKWRVDEEKKYILKKIGAIDLDNFNVFEFISNKDSKWDEVFHSPPDPSKPVLVFINRTYLVLGKNYKKILPEYSPMLILHDEMHSATNNTSFEFLMYAKESWNSSLIGFSATPIRIGYSSKKDIQNIEKINKIFSNWMHGIVPIPESHIYMSYPIIRAIADDLCCPIKFKNFEISMFDEFGKKSRFDPYDIQDFRIIMEVINNSVVEMPHKKIVAWLSTKNNADSFNKLFIQYKTEYSNLRDMESFIDHSGKTTTEYLTYAKKEKNAILFCVNKHREGSDIQNLDIVIFLDKTVKRGYIVFLQSIGRVARKSENKSFGLVIEGIYRNSDFTKNEIFRKYIDKIVFYYLILDKKNIISITNDDKLRTYYNILNNIYLNDQKQSVMIRQEGLESPLEVSINEIDWEDFSENFSHLFQNTLQNALGMNQKIITELTFKRIGDYLNFNIQSHFWEEIEKLTPEQYIYLQIDPDFIKKNIDIIEENNINFFDAMSFDCSIYPQTIDELFERMINFTYSDGMNEEEIWRYCFDKNILPYSCVEYLKKLGIKFVKFIDILREKTRKKLLLF